MASNRYAVETAFKVIDRATEPLSKIGVKGNAVGKILKKDFMKAQDQLASLGKAAAKAGAAIAAAGVAAAGAFAVKGIKDAIEFNTAFTKVSTVADTTKISLDDLNKSLLDISNKTGVAATELAKLQYDAIVSGISTADSVDFLSTAVKASKASFTDTGTVIDALTSVLNAYQLEAKDAEKIAGQMLITNNLGKTSFEELNKSMGKVLPTAARLNVGTDELFSSIAALTANSIETPKAIKGMEKILETVQKPTDAAAKAARQLGIDFSVTALRSKGLTGFLEDIKQKTGGSEEAIMALFGSVESLNAINVLTGRGAAAFSSAMEEMKNASGAVDSAFNKVMETPAERWAKITNKFKNSGINLGTALLPMIEKLMEKAELFIDKIKDFDFTPIADKAGKVFDKIIGFAGHFIWLAGLIWKLRVPIIAVVGAIALYKGGMILAAAAANGFTAAQNILKAAKLGVYLVTGNLTKATALYKAGTMGASIQTLLFAARQKAVQMVNFAGTIIKQGAAFIALKAQLIAAKIATIAYSVAQKAAAIAGKIAAGAQWALNAAMTANPIGLIIAGIVALITVVILCAKNWDKITGALKRAWEWIKNIYSIVKDKLINAFNGLPEPIKKGIKAVAAFIAIFMGPFGIILNVIRNLIKNWGAIVEAFKTEGIIGGLKKLGSVIFSAILEPFKVVWNFISNIFSWIKDKFTKVFKSLPEPIQNVIKKILGFISIFTGPFKVIFNVIKSLKENWGAIVEAFKTEGIIGGLKKLGSVIFSAVLGPFKSLWDGVKNLAGKAWDGIKNRAGQTVNNMQQGWAAFKDFSGNVWGGIKNIAGSAWDGVKNIASQTINNMQQGWAAFKDFSGNAWDGIKNIAGKALESIGDVGSSIKNKLTDSFKSFSETTKNVLGDVCNTWSEIVNVFKTEGIIAGFKKLGGIILSAVLTPVQGLIEMLAKIPGVNKLLGPAVEKIKEFKENLKGNEADAAITNNVKPVINTNDKIKQVTELQLEQAKLSGNTQAIEALTKKIEFLNPGQTITQTNPAPVSVIMPEAQQKINNVTPRALPQLTRSTGVPAMPQYNVTDKNARTVTAASIQPTRPITTAEQYKYSETTNREQVDINVKAEPGTQARVPRQVKSPNVKLEHSGAN